MKLVVQSLAVDRGENTVLSGISFEVAKGRALVVTGPNGSGKSTLLKTLAGLLKPSAGTFRLEGADGNPFARHCHYLSHANALKSALTVEENLSFWREFLGAPGTTVAAALEKVGLAGTGQLPARFLSAGQQRRVAIARLLVNRRPVWLIDEPTAALDANAEKRFGQILRQHLKAGGIAVISTHQKLSLEKPLRLELAPLGAAVR